MQTFSAASKRRKKKFSLEFQLSIWRTKMPSTLHERYKSIKYVKSYFVVRVYSRECMYERERERVKGFPSHQKKLEARKKWKFLTFH